MCLLGSLVLIRLTSTNCLLVLSERSPEFSLDPTFLTQHNTSYQTHKSAHEIFLMEFNFVCLPKWFSTVLKFGYVLFRPGKN